MTTVLAVFAGILGFVVAPFLESVADRATDSGRPQLLRRDEVTVATIVGRRTARSAAVRLTTAGLAAGVVVMVGGGFTAPAYLWFVAVTVVVTLTDIDTKLIPNRVTLPAAVVGAPLLAAGALLDGDPQRLLWALAGGLGYGIYLLIIALIVPSGFGFGDVKLAPILGWFVGAESLSFVPVAVIATHLAGGLASLLLLATRVKSRKDHIPFGPYMVIGAYVALFAGRAIVDWYVG